MFIQFLLTVFVIYSASESMREAAILVFGDEIRMLDLLTDNSFVSFALPVVLEVVSCNIALISKI